MLNSTTLHLNNNPTPHQIQKTNDLIGGLEIVDSKFPIKEINFSKKSARVIKFNNKKLPGTNDTEQ